MVLSSGHDMYYLILFFYCSTEFFTGSLRLVAIVAIC